MGFSRNIGSIAGAILIVALVFCCTEKANVHIEIRAASNVDEPIGSASVIINGLKVGETDATGKFSTDDLFPAQSSLAIRVEKNSVNSYISPYFEKIWISKHEAQRVSVNATLFSVPKSHFATGDGPISPPSEDTVKPLYLTSHQNRRTCYQLLGKLIQPQIKSKKSLAQQVSPRSKQKKSTLHHLPSIAFPSQQKRTQSRLF